MNTKVLLIIGLILVLSGSCQKFLDPYPGGIVTSEDIWKYQANVQGLIGECYDNMSLNYNNNEG